MVNVSSLILLADSYDALRVGAADIPGQPAYLLGNEEDSRNIWFQFAVYLVLARLREISFPR